MWQMGTWSKPDVLRLSFTGMTGPDILQYLRVINWQWDTTSLTQFLRMSSQFSSELILEIDVGGDQVHLEQISLY